MFIRFIKQSILFSCLILSTQLAFALNCPPLGKLKYYHSVWAMPYGVEQSQQKAQFVDFAMTPQTTFSNNGWVFMAYPIVAGSDEDIHALSEKLIHQLRLFSTTPYQYKPFNQSVFESDDEDYGESEKVLDLSFCVYHSPIQPNLNVLAFYLDSFQDGSDAIRQMKSKAAFLLK